MQLSVFLVWFLHFVRNILQNVLTLVWSFETSRIAHIEVSYSIWHYLPSEQVSSIVGPKGGARNTFIVWRSMKAWKVRSSTVFRSKSRLSEYQACLLHRKAGFDFLPGYWLSFLRLHLPSPLSKLYLKISCVCFPSCACEFWFTNIPRSFHCTYTVSLLREHMC